MGGFAGAFVRFDSVEVETQSVLYFFQSRNSECQRENRLVISNLHTEIEPSSLITFKDFYKHLRQFGLITVGRKAIKM